MRLDRDHLAGRPDMARQHHGVGADIGADVDEHAADRRMRAQKIQLLDIVIGIEQGAAFGGAGLVIEAERRALIGDIDRPGAQQIDQPRQHRAKRAALQPRAMGQPDDGGLRGCRGERAERRGRRVIVGLQADILGESGTCIAGFSAAIQRHRCPRGSSGPYAAMTLMGLNRLSQSRGTMRPSFAKISAGWQSSVMRNT